MEKSREEVGSRGRRGGQDILEVVGDVDDDRRFEVPEEVFLGSGPGVGFDFCFDFEFDFDLGGMMLTTVIVVLCR